MPVDAKNAFFLILIPIFSLMNRISANFFINGVINEN